MDGRVFLKDALLSMAKMEAADLYLKPHQPPWYRLAGNIHPMQAPALSVPQVGELVDQLTNAYQKKLLEEYGSVDFALDIETVGRVRVNLFSQRGLHCFVIRRIRSDIPSFEELHIPAILKTIAEEPRGLVLIGGATSSGKTTTIAAMIDHVNATQEKHIITVEDPIEYSFPDKKSMVNQREVGDDTVSFHSALRYIVRQSPDFIMIGEMRDQETFSSALAAAETGRLLISTVHARNVTQVFDRILGFFPPSQHDQIMVQLSFNLRAVCVQRLLLQKDGVSVIPAFEILTMTPEVSKLIRERRVSQLVQVMQQGTQDGMQTFNQAIFRLFKEERITQEEAFQASDNPQALAMNMKGIFLDEGSGGILGRKS